MIYLACSQTLTILVSSFMIKFSAISSQRAASSVLVDASRATPVPYDQHMIEGRHVDLTTKSTKIKNVAAAAATAAAANLASQERVVIFEKKCVKNLK